jgi:hypothetical protein
MAKSLPVCPVFVSEKGFYEGKAPDSQVKFWLLQFRGYQCVTPIY